MQPSAPSRLRRWLKRLRKIVVWCVALAVLAALIFNVVLRVIGGRELRAVVARLDADDPGWRWDELNADKPKLQDEDNACLKMLALARQVRESIDGEDSLPSMRERPANEQFVERDLQLLAAYANAVPLNLAKVREFGEMPRGQWPSTTPEELFSKSDWAPLPRHVAHWLHAQALLHSYHNRPVDAIGAFHLQLDVHGVGNCDVPMMNFLGQCAVNRTAIRGLEHTLGKCDKCPPELLVQTRKKIFDEANRLQIAPAFRRERAWLFHMMRVMAEGPHSFGKVMSVAAPELGRDDLWNGIRRWEVRGWYWHSQALALDLSTQAVDIARQPLEEQAALFDKLAERSKERRSSALDMYWNSQGNLAINEWIAVASANLRTHATLRCAQVALALEEFRLKHDRWPNSLAELEKEIDIKIPLDPFDGRPLRYLKRTDGVTVYSVGRDRTDNGGKLPKKWSDQRDVDEGFQLWDPKHRRQPPVIDDRPPLGFGPMGPMQGIPPKE